MQRQKHPLCSNSDREPAMRHAVYQPGRPRDVTTTSQGRSQRHKNVMNIGKKNVNTTANKRSKSKIDIVIKSILVTHLEIYKIYITSEATWVNM